MLKTWNIYALQVLLSGLASLNLQTKDYYLLNQYHKKLVISFLKLPDETPQSAAFFIAGTLPVKASLHLKQFTLFGMIMRLPSDPLFEHAKYVLTTSRGKPWSWFEHLRELCLMYGLPHPLSFLENPPTKTTYNRLINAKIVDYWESTLRSEAVNLSSLRYFKPAYMSLCKPHPLLWTAGSNPYEVSKAVVQCKMLSGRYRTASLISKWANSNGDPFCLFPQCHAAEVEENLEHVFLFCPAYQDVRLSLLQKWCQHEDPKVSALLRQAVTGPSSYFVQFLLDPSVFASVRSIVSSDGQNILYSLFFLTRTWCFAIHQKRIKLFSL